jgi:hypothetical protein
VSGECGAPLWWIGAATPYVARTSTSGWAPNAAAGGIPAISGMMVVRSGNASIWSSPSASPRLSSVATMCQDVALWDRQLTWGVV